jgi:hypothetical protein
MRLLIKFLIILFSIIFSNDENFSVYQRYFINNENDIVYVNKKATVDVETEEISYIEVLMFGNVLNNKDIIIYHLKNGPPNAKIIDTKNRDSEYRTFSIEWRDIQKNKKIKFGKPEEKKYLINPDDIFDSKNSIELTYNKTNQIHSKDNANDLPREVAEEINWENARDNKLPKKGKYVKVVFSSTDAEYQEVDGEKKRMSQEITELKKEQNKNSKKIKELQKIKDVTDSTRVRNLDLNPALPEWIEGKTLTELITTNKEISPYLYEVEGDLIARDITVYDRSKYPEVTSETYEIWEKGKRLPESKLYINLNQNSNREEDVIEIKRFSSNTEIESKVLTFVKPESWNPSDSYMVSFDREIEAKKSINLDNKSINKVFFDKEIPSKNLNVYMTKNEIEISNDGSISIIKRKRNESINEMNKRLAEEKNAKKQKDSIEKISAFSRNVIIPVIVFFIGVG